MASLLGVWRDANPLPRGGQAGAREAPRCSLLPRAGGELEVERSGLVAVDGDLDLPPAWIQPDIADVIALTEPGPGAPRFALVDLAPDQPALDAVGRKPAARNLDLPVAVLDGHEERQVLVLVDVELGGAARHIHAGAVHGAGGNRRVGEIGVDEVVRRAAFPSRLAALFFTLATRARLSRERCGRALKRARPPGMLGKASQKVRDLATRRPVARKHPDAPLHRSMIREEESIGGAQRLLLAHFLDAHQDLHGLGIGLHLPQLVLALALVAAGRAKRRVVAEHVAG